MEAQSASIRFIEEERIPQPTTVCVSGGDGEICFWDYDLPWAEFHLTNNDKNASDPSRMR